MRDSYLIPQHVSKSDYDWLLDYYYEDISETETISKLPNSELHIPMKYMSKLV